MADRGAATLTQPPVLTAGELTRPSRGLGLVTVDLTPDCYVASEITRSTRVIGPHEASVAGPW